MNIQFKAHQNCFNSLALNGCTSFSLSFLPAFARLHPSKQTSYIKIGVDHTFSAAIAYGVAITLPREPSWTILQHRLEKFDDSLLAKAARAVPENNLKQEDIPEQIRKSAKLLKSVLISQTDKDDMSQEEVEMAKEEGDVEELSQPALKALNKIFGEGHGLELKAFCGGDYYDGDLQTALVLVHAASCVNVDDGDLGVGVANLNLPFVRNAEVDEVIARALRAFGMEAESGPGWKLVTTASRC